MKRMTILFVLLAMMLVGGASAQPHSLTIGLIAYQADALVWPISQYQAALEADLDLLPVPEQFPEERLLNPITEGIPPIDLIAKEAGTVGQQIAAISDLVAVGIDGLVIMPAGQDETLVHALQEAMNAGIPVVTVHRDMPSLVSPLKAYVGLEHHQLGFAIGRGALGVTPQGQQKYPLHEEDRFVVLAKNLDDPVEQRLSQGFVSAIGKHGTGVFQVAPSGSYAHTQKMMAQIPGLTSIFLTNVELVPGTLQAVREVATPGEHIRVVSYGAPPDFKALITDDVFNGCVSQDYYGIFLASLVQLKKFLVQGAALQNEYIPVELRMRFHLPYGTFTRYPYESPFGFDLLFMWWFG